VFGELLVATRLGGVLPFLYTTISPDQIFLAFQKKKTKLDAHLNVRLTIWIELSLVVQPVILGA
jgi:hypothetical protein